MTVVTVEVRLDPEADLADGAVVHVLVQDTSRADAAALTVADATVTLAPGDSSVRTAVEVPEVDPTLHLTVRAHADVVGDGAIHPGDQVSVESIPVVTRDAPTDVVVQLRAVP